VEGGSTGMSWNLGIGGGRGGSRTGRGGGIGDEAVRRCHVGEGVVRREQHNSLPNLGDDTGPPTRG
jgi:hypothetical protein